MRRKSFTLVYVFFMMMMGISFAEEKDSSFSFIHQIFFDFTKTELTGDSKNADILLDKISSKLTAEISYANPINKNLHSFVRLFDLKAADRSFYICNIRKLELDSLDEPVSIDFDIILYKNSFNEENSYKLIFTYSYAFQKAYSIEKNYNILGKLIKNRIFYTRFLRNSKIRLGVSGTFFGLGLAGWLYCGLDYFIFQGGGSIMPMILYPSVAQLIFVPVPFFINNIFNIIVAKKKLSINNYENFDTAYERKFHRMKILFSLSTAVVVTSLLEISTGIFLTTMFQVGIFLIPIFSGIAAFALPGMILTILQLKKLNQTSSIFTGTAKRLNSNLEFYASMTGNFSGISAKINF